MSLSTRQQWYAVAGTVAVIAGGLAAATLAAPDGIPPVAVGSVAPDFQARAIADSTVTRRRRDYAGRLVLLNVWATWCIPCRTEMPSIQRLHEEFAGRGLTVVAVSIDDPGQADAIREFVRELGLTFEILHDPARRITETYQMPGVPQSFLIDRYGIIRKKVFATDWYSEENRTLVGKLLQSS